MFYSENGQTFGLAIKEAQVYWLARQKQFINAFFMKKILNYDKVLVITEVKVVTKRGKIKIKVTNY